MEIKFIKYLKTTNQLFLSVGGESVCFAVDFSAGVPFISPAAGSVEGLDAGIEYLKDKLGSEIVERAKDGTKFMPLGTGMFNRLISLSGPMNNGRWKAVVDFDINAPRSYRAPSPAVSFCHFVHSGTILDNPRHFVAITTRRYFLLLTDDGAIYSRVGVEVPAGSDIVNYVSAGTAFMNHIIEGRKGISDKVSGEAVNITVDMKTGSVDFLSGGSHTRYNKMSTDARLVGREICEYFGLTVPQALIDDKVIDDVTFNKGITLGELFNLGDTVGPYLPGETIRCEEAMKYGDYYYFIHGSELSHGEKDGVLIRMETVRYGTTKNDTVYTADTPIAVLFDYYGVTREVSQIVAVTDFTGMADKEFTKYLKGRCR